MSQHVTSTTTPNSHQCFLICNHQLNQIKLFLKPLCYFRFVTLLNLWIFYGFPGFQCFFLGCFPVCVPRLFLDIDGLLWTEHCLFLTCAFDYSLDFIVIFMCSIIFACSIIFGSLVFVCPCLNVLTFPVEPLNCLAPCFVLNSPCTSVVCSMTRCTSNTVLIIWEYFYCTLLEMLLSILSITLIHFALIHVPDTFSVSNTDLNKTIHMFLHRGIHKISWACK